MSGVAPNSPRGVLYSISCAAGKWRECSTVFKVNAKKSARNVGIDQKDA